MISRCVAAAARDANQMKKHAFSFDFIFDTVSAQRDIYQYINSSPPMATPVWSVVSPSRWRSLRST